MRKRSRAGYGSRSGAWRRREDLDRWLCPAWEIAEPLDGSPPQVVRVHQMTGEVVVTLLTDEVASP